MADNETEGSNGSFRQNQGSKKRREPPIIDAKATDVSSVPPVPETPPPEAAAEPASAKETEEPVLFGQVLRGPTSTPSKPDAMEDPASADPEPSAETPPLAASTSYDHVKGAPDEVVPPETSVGQDGFGAAPPGVVAPPPKRSGVATLLGVVVALLLFVIAGLLFMGPQRGGAEDLRAALDAADARIDALEARPDPAKLTGDVAGLTTELAALKKSADETAARLADIGSEAQANTTKLAALTPPAPTDATPNGASSAAPPAPGETSAAPATPAPVAMPVAAAADVSALAARVDDIARKMDALPAPAAAVDLGPLQAKVGDLAQGLETVQASVAALPKVDLAPLDGRMADLDRRIGTLDHGMQGMAASIAALPKPDLDPLKAGIAALAQRVEPLEAALSTPKDGDRVTEARATGSAEVARAAPLAMVAQAITRGIDEGRPLTSEVEALKGLGIDEATLKPLSGIAARGAPTVAALKAQWATLEPDVLATGAPAPTSLLDRFTAGARQIVTVKRVGAPVGEDPTSVAGRVSAALDDGDLPGALAEWARLPAAGRAASQAWADAARSRLDAMAAAQGLASGAIDTLAKAKG